VPRPRPEPCHSADKLTVADRTIGLGVGFVQAERDDTHSPVVVASVQTLARQARLDRVPRRFDTVVVDEAHHAAARPTNASSTTSTPPR
jgi:superfamily II DNA or RNA helicase